MNANSRSTKLYAVIEAQTNQIDFSAHPLADAMEPLQLSALAQKTQIAASNVSMVLSQLYKEGRLLRVGKRPVYYLALQPLEVSLKLRFPSDRFDSLEEFEAFLASALNGAIERSVQNTIFEDPFATVIGASGSLRQQVVQAKSALTYPPAGLPTLLIGPMGAGKESFARCMYNFALQKRLIPKNAGLTVYDCANYVRNPTQAISRLFGHIAGAFSSAKTDHIGLLEYANNGVLLLFNVDKLIPELQEKLIRYIATGTYGRLGEGDAARTGSARLIATATSSETTQSEILRLFPVQISLASLETRTIGERLRLILNFFWRESNSLKRPIILGTEILIFLTHYSCPGNISQLMNDIKFSCSLAYYDSHIKNDTHIRVSVQHLSPSVSQNFFIRFTNQREMLVKQQLRDPDRPININGLRPFDELMDAYLLPDPDTA